MFVATYTNEITNHQFNIYIDTDTISTVESATKRANILLTETLKEEKSNYVFNTVRAVSLEEFYRLKGKKMEPVAEHSDDDDDVVLVSLNDIAEDEEPILLMGDDL